MSTLSPSLRSGILILLTLLTTGGVLMPGLARAQSTTSDAGLAVEGVIADYTVEPGQVLTHHLSVKLGKDATAPYDVLVEARGLGQGPEGGTLALEADQDTGRLSARQFISQIDHPSFHLDPGSAQAVTATITVPHDLQPGTRYADIYVHTQPTGSGRVGVILATHIPVILTMTGAAFAETGSITKLDVAPVQSGEPIQVSTVVQNTGDHHYRASALVSILDSSGKQVAQRLVPQAGSSILPGFPRSYTTSFALLNTPEGLPAGTYSAESKVVLEDGRLLDDKKTEFQIKTPYQAFPDIDPSTLVVVTYNDEVPAPIDARAKADLQVVFRDTGKVTGTVGVGRYKNEPAGTPRISDPLRDLGLGKPGLTYWGISVDGFSKGTAEVTAFYRDPELNGVAANTLLLADRPAGTTGWAKLDNLAVFPNAQNVRGDLNVQVLNANSPIGLAGDLPAPLGPLDLLIANWQLAAGALAIVALLAAAALVVRHRLRRSQAWSA